MRRWTRAISIVTLVLVVLATSDGLFPGTAAAVGPDSRFGLDFVSPPGVVADDGRFGKATELGIGWDRFPMYWSSMQTTAGGAIDFTAADATVNADLAHGLNVQAILVGAPSWATSSGTIDLNAWSSFVNQTVTHYNGKIHYWEMWNEPDLLNAQGQGQYWTWGVPAYYQLVKTGYLAVKAADPSATVLLGGLAFPYNNQDFFPQFLAQVTADPSAAANHGYFDVLPFHSYDRVMRTYQLPLGYFGSPSFAGFLPLLRKAGLSPQIWINELGVPIWDYQSGQSAPGRSTQDEQASYIVESLADGLAAGIQKFFVFQLYDDGAGAVDPKSNLPAEFFGLIANDGTQRLSYAAYASAISLFSGAQAVTHLNGQRGSNFSNHKGVEAVTLYGTARGKVTVLWNDDPGNPITVAIPTNDASATILDKLGHTVGQVNAVNGVDTVTLPAATNNNNFDCFTPHGCDPNDYIIGGSPVILVENDGAVPPVVFDPLPFDSVAPVHLSWHTTQPAPTGATYDVQYRDTTDSAWHDLVTGAAATDALFGDGSAQLQSGDSYDFRVRAHDGSGNLVGGMDYPPRALASTLVIGGNVARPDASIDAKIEIVWPLSNLPVSKATKANVTAMLFGHGTTTSVGPSFGKTVKLWQALNNGVGQPIATGTLRLAQAGRLRFPVWDFNHVDVSAARDSKNKDYFWVTVDGQRINTNVWAHGVDARTYFPKQDTPASVLARAPSAVDAKIEIVWPHDNQPVAKASQVNVGVDLFGHGTLQSVPASFNPVVRLYRAVNNGPLEEIGSGDPVPQTVNGITFPTWQFNNVDVSAAQDPHNKIYFRVAVDGVTSYSNVWTHGVDARTFFPKQDMPTGVEPSATPTPTASATPPAASAAAAVVTTTPVATASTPTTIPTSTPGSAAGTPTATPTSAGPTPTPTVSRSPSATPNPNGV
ncbi:MAG TPA: hypothetical protein VNL16_18605 [Chloroflexota bacterium]|nr:hypothetical protein [Chloroflexota bacterium]